MSFFQNSCGPTARVVRPRGRRENSGNARRSGSLIARLAVLAMITTLSGTTLAADPYYHTLFDFPATAANTRPDGGLAIIGSKLYGTTSGQYVDSNGYGTVYSLDLDGTGFQTLHTFAGTDGGNPEAALLAIGSTLYGTTSGSRVGQPVHSYGSIFSIDGDGSNFQELHEFSSDGLSFPQSGLTLVGGSLIGAGYAEGGLGVYSIAPDGSDFQLRSYTTNATPTGSLPHGSVTPAGSLLYGAASSGGSYNNGLVYSTNLDGSNFQTLHSFAGDSAPGNPPPDGARPTTDVTIVGSRLYGTTFAGGSESDGTIYSMNLDGSDYQVLHQFDGDDGLRPSALVHHGSTLYGVANSTLFAINDNGSNFHVLENFADVQGSGAASNLLLVGSTLYGTTTFGGANDAGMIFSYQLPGPPQAIIDPAQSVLTLTAGPFGGPLLTPQAPGSLATQIIGSFSLDLSDPTRLVMLPGTRVALAEQPGTFEPDGLKGAFAGSYPGQDNSIFARWDAFQIVIGTRSPLAIDEQGNFDASLLDIDVRGALMHMGTSSADNTLWDIRNTIVNQPSQLGSMVRAGNGYELTIPLHFTLNGPLAQTFDGQIVAFVSVPEPSSLTQFIGLAATLTAGLSVKRLRGRRGK